MIGDAKPLTNWANAPTIRSLKQDYLDAKPSHDNQVTKVNTYLENMNVTGKAKPEKVKGRSSVQPKLIRKQAEWRYPALSDPFLSTYDLFEVKPKTWEDRNAARQNSLVLNSQINTGMDKVAFIDQYVRTAVDEGTILCRVGWDFEEEQYDKEVPDVRFVVDPEFVPTLQAVQQLKQESPSQYMTDVPEELQQALDVSEQEGQPVRPEIIGKKMVKAMRTLKNRPTVEVVDVNNVTLDPTAKGDIEKANFLVYHWETSLAELKKEPKKYKNLDKISIEGSSILAEPDHKPDAGQTDFNFSDKTRKKFVIYEYWGKWDINGDGTVVSIVAAWVGDTMVRLELNPFPDKAIPFVLVQYLPVRGENYGEPDGALLEDNQKIAGAVTRGMIDLLGKSANGQTGIGKGLLDVTNRRKFDKGEDYEFNPQQDPRQAVYMHTFPEIPQSAQFMLQLQNFDAEAMTGVRSFSQGVSGASLGDVAAGVRGALDAASKRELAILRRLSQGIVKIGRKWISMNAEWLSETEVVRLSNEEFVQVRKDDLPGNFDLELGISTAEEDNNKAEQLAFLFQTIGPNGDPEMTKMILADIARLRKMPDMAKKIESFQPQPDPMAVQKAQLELKLLEAQIAKEQAQAMHYASRTQLDGAKVGTETAKQGHIQSQTDKNNLDFVEQESGVTQEREKELHGEQARSNLAAKVAERQFDREDNQHDLIKEYLKAKLKK